MTVSDVLPMGAVFPFDFGFVPCTQAPDGDPLDVLVVKQAQVGGKRTPPASAGQDKHRVG